MAIGGASADFNFHGFDIFAGLNVAQVKVITVLLECKEINFEAIPAECKKRFGGDLGYPGQLKAWLCNIPGLVISPSKMCTCEYFPLAIDYVTKSSVVLHLTKRNIVQTIRLEGACLT